uniref:Uncharacterized protein n=1 Tax=Hemiselmis tepida TaxID=464990 RepID=A0A7S0Z1X2_9CRYP
MSLQILSHVYTRVQEEMEKIVDPAVGLLHRLLRQVEQPGIRNNILEKYLKPKPEDEWEMAFVDGDMVTDFGCEVDPLKLSLAMSTYLQRVRDEGAFDEDAVGQTYADCRVIAKDARVWVEQFYDQEMLDDFTESLTPVFQPIMKTLEKYERPPAPPEDEE